MRVAIIGSRTFTDEETIREVVKSLHQQNPNLMIISGGARGADQIGERAADELGIPKKIFQPQWHIYGRRAGFVRNELIIEAAERVFAFFAPGPKSNGTQHSVDLAIKANKEVHIFHEGRWTHYWSKGDAR